MKSVSLSSYQQVTLHNSFICNYIVYPKNNDGKFSLIVVDDGTIIGLKCVRLSSYHQIIYTSIHMHLYSVSLNNGEIIQSYSTSLWYSGTEGCYSEEKKWSVKNGSSYCHFKVLKLRFDILKVSFCH